MGRPTSQSSTDNQHSGSNLAVDGKHDKCSPQDNQYAKTGLQQNPSWTVTLDKVYDVRSIILYSVFNKFDYTGSLSNINIYVINNGKSSFCANTGNMDGIAKSEFTCKFDAIGNIVKLERKGDGQLQICEVMVYGHIGK